MVAPIYNSYNYFSAPTVTPVPEFFSVDTSNLSTRRIKKLQQKLNKPGNLFNAQLLNQYDQVLNAQRPVVVPHTYRPFFQPVTSWAGFVHPSFTYSWPPVHPFVQNIVNYPMNFVQDATETIQKTGKELFIENPAIQKSLNTLYDDFIKKAGGGIKTALKVAT